MAEQDEIAALAEAGQADLLRAFGFRWGDKGTHTSRTMMLDELRLLMAACPADAGVQQYRAAVEGENRLRKRTAATRRLSAQRLRELYALDPDIPLFRVMRVLWYADPNGHPLLAVLLALARDPLLRATAPTVLRMRPGEELARQQVTDAIRQTAGDRLNDSTLDKVVRNAAASWTYSGHLRGRGRKARQEVVPRPGAVAYSLFLGYVLGARAEALFRTLWARVLGARAEQIMTRALDARRLGFLDMSQSGGVVAVSFSRLLTDDERQLIHGADRGTS